MIAIRIWYPNQNLKRSQTLSKIIPWLAREGIGYIPLLPEEQMPYLSAVKLHDFDSNRAMVLILRAKSWNVAFWISRAKINFGPRPSNQPSILSSNFNLKYQILWVFNWFPTNLSVWWNKLLQGHNSFTQFVFPLL